MVAQRHDAFPDLTGTPLPVKDLKFIAFFQLEVAFLRAPHDRFGQRVFAATLKAGSQQQNLLLLKTIEGNHRYQFGFAFGQRAGLVHHQGVDLAQISSASAFLINTPIMAPLPVPTMIDTGVASPRAQGQAMIKTATELMTAYASAGSAPKTTKRQK